jgi:hypothetical protein
VGESGCVSFETVFAATDRNDKIFLSLRCLIGYRAYEEIYFYTVYCHCVVIFM